MSIERKIPHSFDRQEEDSISAPQNLHGNPSMWRRISDWYWVASWFPFKWMVVGIYAIFGNDVPVPVEVRELVNRNRVPSRKGWMQGEVERNHRFIQAVQTLQDTEPLSPAMKLVLDEAINVAGSALSFVREKQEEREVFESTSEGENQLSDKEIDEMLQPDPDDPSLSEP